MLENILTNYATFTSHYTVFTANVVWTTLSSPCGTLHKHLARQAPCCIAEQVFCCLCLTFITNLNFVHITALLEYGFSSSSKVTPSQCEMLPPRMCNTLQNHKNTYYFTFIEVPAVQQDGITLSLTCLSQILFYFSMKFLRG